MTYILVDTANTFFRARHVVNGSSDIKLGMAFHITFNSIKKAWHDFEGKHVVLVQVSANLNRLFPSVVPEVLVTENGFSRFKHLHAEIMIYFDFDINQA